MSEGIPRAEATTAKALWEWEGVRLGVWSETSTCICYNYISEILYVPFSNYYNNGMIRWNALKYHKLKHGFF